MSNPVYNLKKEIWHGSFGRVYRGEEPKTKALYAITKSFTEKFGVYKEDEKSFEGYKKETYYPNNPKQYLITIIDHIKLLSVSLYLSSMVWSDNVYK